MNKYLVASVKKSGNNVTVSILINSDKIEKYRLSGKLFSNFQVDKGSVLSEEKFNSLKTDSEKCEAITKALQLISVSPLSINKLKEKLHFKGFSRESCDYAAKAMLKLGYINEKEQAERIAEKDVLDKNIGRNKITADLVSKGYPYKESREAAESISSEMYFDALSRCFDKKYGGCFPSEKSEAEKVIAYLLRRGFNYSEIKKLLIEICSNN